MGRLLRNVLDLLALPDDVCVEIMPEMPTLEVNPVKLSQVFSNLIGNAAKYRNPEHCRIVIEWQDKTSFFEFSVSDNGPGISPQYQDKVFGFFQTFNSNPAVESSGVGLAIVMKIVVARGGSISIESQLGAGASFRFLWPKETVKPSEGQ